MTNDECCTRRRYQGDEESHPTVFVDVLVSPFTWQGFCTTGVFYGIGARSPGLCKGSTLHIRYPKQTIFLRKLWHWKPRVLIMLTLSSLAAPEIVITATSCANGDDKVGIMTTLDFRWILQSWDRVEVKIKCIDMGNIAIRKWSLYHFITTGSPPTGTRTNIGNSSVLDRILNKNTDI